MVSWEPCHSLSPPVGRWRLTAGTRVRLRSWGDESVVLFDGPGETMVVTALGSVAVAGILAGCADFPALEAWCRDHGFDDTGGEVLEGLKSLLGQLAEREVVEPAP